MIDITIEEIFDRLFNELKTGYKSIEPWEENHNDYKIMISLETINKKNLKFIRHINRNMTEYSILANEEVVFSGIYSSEIKEEYNNEEARLLNKLWKNLEMIILNYGEKIKICYINAKNKNILTEN